jgi:uncharacterized protein YeeX (DUF496 family)
MPEEDEYEISESKDDYEVVALTPVRRLEKRVEDLEKGEQIPQIQGLITQIVDLIRNNQKIVNDVIRSNTELRNELSRIPSKLDDLTTTMKSFISMVEAAGREDITAPGPEAFKPLTNEIQKMIDQNQKIIEGQQAVVDQLDNINRKLKAGTPVSQLLSQYPGMKMRREEV